MENHTDSRDSSPRSCENPSFDDPPSNLNAINYKLKFMCSYGGKIQPRPHDNQLTYTGGHTKILAVDRHISFAALSYRLISLCNVNVSFKYQLPGEDLDALISVTNDEDLDHMLLEYDRLYRVSKPARLRLFLFPLNPPAPTILEHKSDRQWFVDALNFVRIHPFEDSSPPADASGSASNPDFLFGFDKPHPLVSGSNLQRRPNPARSDCGSEDRQVVGELVVSPSEFQPRSSDDINSSQPPRVTEKIGSPPAEIPLAVPMPVPVGYLPERQMISGGYPVASAPAADQSIYLIPTGGGLFQAQKLRPMNVPIGHQPYYGMNSAQPNVGVYTTEGVQMMQPKVAYDNTGRHVYFTTAPPYQTMAPVAVDGRAGAGGAGSYNPGGKVIRPSKESGL